MMATLRRIFGLSTRSDRPALDLSPSPERLERQEKTQRLIDEYSRTNGAEQRRLVAEAQSQTRYYQALASAMEILK
jgi:hypothetical protein